MQYFGLVKINFAAFVEGGLEIIASYLSRIIQGDTGLPGPVGTKGQKGEKGGIGLPGRRVSHKDELYFTGYYCRV